MSGQASPELEIVTRTLRVKDRAGAARAVPADGHPRRPRVPTGVRPGARRRVRRCSPQRRRPQATEAIPWSASACSRSWRRRPAIRRTCWRSTSTWRPTSGWTPSSRPRPSRRCGKPTTSRATTSSSCATSRPWRTSSSSCTTAGPIWPTAAACRRPPRVAPRRRRRRRRPPERTTCAGAGARDRGGEDRLSAGHAGARPRSRGRPRGGHRQAGRDLRGGAAGLRHPARRQAQAARLPDARPRHPVRARPPPRRRSAPSAGAGGRGHRERAASTAPRRRRACTRRRAFRAGCRCRCSGPALDLCKPTGVDAREGQPRPRHGRRRRGGRGAGERLARSGRRRRWSSRTRRRPRRSSSGCGTGCAEGPIQGIYWLPALDREPELDEMDLAAWREALRVRAKLLHVALRLLDDGMDDAGPLPGGGDAARGTARLRRRGRAGADGRRGDGTS